MKSSKYIGSRDFYRHVLAISVPIMLQNGITNFVSMLDNIMVGGAGKVEMTGVAVSNQLIFVFTLCIFGAVSGAGIFGAQFYGKKDYVGMRNSFRFKLWLAVILTLIAGVTFGFFGNELIEPFLRGEGAPEDAAGSLKAAKDYLLVMIVGLLPTALAQCYASSLRETGETLMPMKAGLIAVAVNLCFNYILIFGHFGAPRLGAVGAAVATVMSRYVELAIAAVWTHKNKERFKFIEGAYRSAKIPAVLTVQMLKKGMPLMINEALWAAGIALLNQSYSTRGLDVVAAVNISSTFWNVFSVIFMAVGTSIGIIVGQQLGAGEFDKARDSDRKMMVFSIMISVIVAVIYVGAAQFIPDFYKVDAEIRALATKIMCISAAFMPVNAYAHASYFTLRSGGQTFVTFLFDSCFVWVVTVPLAFVLSRYTDVAILPLYAACQAVDIIKCIIGTVLLKKGIWVRNIVTDEV